MAQVLSLSFNLGGELQPSLSNAFKQASSLMSELQDKNSALNKNLSQVNNYSKLEAGLKADKNALEALSAQSVKVKADLQAAGVQVSSLKNQVKTANSEFTSSQSALSLSRAKYAAITEEVAKLKHEMAVAPSDALRKQLSAAELEAVRLKNAMAKDEAQFKTADAKLKVLNKDLKKAESHEKSLSRESQNLAAKTDGVQKSLNNKNSALEKLHSSLTQAGIDTRKLASEQVRLARQSEQAARAQRDLESARARWSAARENLSFSNLSGDFMQAVAGFKLASKPLNVAKDFEAGFARVNAVAFGGTADNKKSKDQLNNLKKLKALALKLGAETKFTAVEAAALEETLARANFNIPQILDMAKPIMDLAVAEGMDLAQAAGILGGLLNSYNLQSKDAAHVADILSQGSMSGNTNAAELGEAYKNVASTAKALNIPLEELTVMLDLLADATITGSEAGNALKSSLARLAKQPKDMAEIFAEYGIAVFDAEGNMRDFFGLLSEAQQKLDKAGAGKFAGLVARAFGTENLAAITALMDKAVEIDAETGLTKVEAKRAKFKPKELNGKAQNVAAVMSNTAVNSETIAGSSFEGLMTTLGEPLLKPWRAMVDYASEAMSSVNKTLQANPNLNTAASYATTAAGAWGVAKFGAKVFTGLKDLASAGFELKRASAAAKAVSVAAQGGGVISAGAASAGAASAGAAGTAGFSLSKLIPIVGTIATAVTTSKWLVDNGAKSVGASGIELGGWGALVKSLGDQAELLKQRRNLDIERNAKLTASLNPAIAARWGVNVAQISQSKIVQAALPGHGENLEQRAEVVKIQAQNQIKNLELPQAWAKRDNYKGWQDVKLDEQGAELINRAAEIKDLKLQEQPVMAENQAKIAEITQLVNQVPVNLSELVNSMHSAEQAIKDLPQNLAPYLERLKNSQPVIINNSQNMSSPQVLQNSRFMSGGSFAAHAKGGIFNTPHFGLVAEAGMEAVIPLEDKSRGVPLWLAAGEEMGLDFASAGMISNSSSSSSVSNLNKPSYNFNITVNAPQSSQAGHGENLEFIIRRAIDNALRDIAEREAMVSFA